jgi:pilus assembly protein CpaF
MNAFAQHIPEIAPTVVIEPFNTIHLPKHKNLVKLESQQAKFMDGANLDNNALLDAALRLKPHRLIVADIDGSEVNGLLQAMYNGLDVMFSMSATDPRDTLARLETMATANSLSTPVIMIRRLIAESIDLIVHVDLMNDAFQRIISITAIEDMQGDMVTMKTIFDREHGLAGGDFVATGVIPERTLARIRNSGKDVSVDESIFEAKS